MISNSDIEQNRSVFNQPQEDGPINKFRNPIWGDDDEDDDDELYHNCGKDGDASEQRNVNVHIYSSETPRKGSQDRFYGESNPDKLDEEINQRIEDAFQTMESFFAGQSGLFGGVHGFFGDMGRVFEDMEKNFGSFDNSFGLVDVPRNDEGNIREQYLKPGYRYGNQENHDNDLDGKILSDDIASLLKRKDHITEVIPKIPFESDRPQTSTSYFKSIVTKTYTKPDGTLETHRIVRDQHGNIEETITTTEPTMSQSNLVIPYSGPEEFPRPDDSLRGIMLTMKSIWKNMFHDDV